MKTFARVLRRIANRIDPPPSLRAGFDQAMRRAAEETEAYFKEVAVELEAGVHTLYLSDGQVFLNGSPLGRMA